MMVECTYKPFSAFSRDMNQNSCLELDKSSSISDQLTEVVLEYLAIEALGQDPWIPDPLSENPAFFPDYQSLGRCIQVSKPSSTYFLSNWRYK